MKDAPFGDMSSHFKSFLSCIGGVTIIPT